jgi:hypothetical protein
MHATANEHNATQPEPTHKHGYRYHLWPGVRGVPLACNGPKPNQISQLLPSEVDFYRRQCNATEDGGAFMRAVQRKLRGAPGCAPETLVRMEKVHLHGLGATLHTLIKPLMYAYAHGKSLLTPPLPELASPAGCRDGLSCYLKPLSVCDKQAAQLAWTQPRRFEDIEVLVGAAEPGGRWVMNMSEKKQNERGQAPEVGWFKFVATLLAYIMHPATGPVERELSMALERTGLGRALERGPVIGLHVRRGDACRPIEIVLTGRKCEPLELYMNRVRQLKRDSGIPASTIYLATDDRHVIDEARAKYSDEFTILHYAMSLEANLRVNPTGILWEESLAKARQRRDFDALSRLTTTNIVDVLLLSRCDLLVGKHTSTYFRMAFELRAARCDCLAPFVSIDSSAWCFDWGVRAGAIGREGRAWHDLAKPMQLVC